MMRGIESDGDDIDDSDDYVKVECDEGDFSTLPHESAAGHVLRGGIVFKTTSFKI